MKNLEGVVCLKQRSFCRKIYENFGACAYNEIKKNKKKQKILRIHEKHRRSVIMKEESYIRNVKYFLEELIRGCGIIQKENPAVQFTKDAKAASMLLYNHLHGKKRNVLFAGPTGCGKTEIWRVLSQLYPNIQVVDGTMLTMEGWSGAFKLRDIFANMSREQAESAIVVIDEFDKLCEPKYGSGGNNYSAAMQNELLKMIEGNKVFFPEDKGKVAMEFDTSKISFVFCGSFETLITRKREINSSIGFGKSIDKSDISVEYKNKIKTEDFTKRRQSLWELIGKKF